MVVGIAAEQAMHAREHGVMYGRQKYFAGMWVYYTSSVLGATHMVTLGQALASVGQEARAGQGKSSVDLFDDQNQACPYLELTDRAGRALLQVLLQRTHQGKNRRHFREALLVVLARIQQGAWQPGKY